MAVNYAGDPLDRQHADPAASIPDEFLEQCNLNPAAYGRTPVTGYKTIRYDRSGHIGNLTLSRPEKRNAQNPLMWRELGSLGSELLRDDTLRCLVVMGEGKSFSAGMDLVEGLAGALADAVERPVEQLTVDAALEEAAGTFTWIPNLGCPSIAAVQGHAYGRSGSEPATGS